MVVVNIKGKHFARFLVTAHSSGTATGSLYIVVILCPSYGFLLCNIYIYIYNVNVAVI